MKNAVGWFEIYVQDLARAKKFYETVLEKTLSPLPTPEWKGPKLEMLAFEMAEGGAGAPGAIVKMDGVSSGPGGTLVYFTCADCSVEESRVEAAGGEVQQSKFSIGQYGFISIISDPDGNTIGLFSET